MSKNAEFNRGNVFSEDFNKIFNDSSCKSVLLESENFPQNDGLKNLRENSNWKSENPKNTLQCSLCRIAFLDVFQQREHYKLDWHRYNLRQSLRSKLSISEEEFSTKTINDEVSSLSGSDSEDNDEKETLDNVAMAQGKIFFQNPNGKIFSMYRVIFLRDKKNELNSINFNEQYEKNCWNNKQWGILMLGGGHFAGAIFQNLEPILHKTFHCYTVRAGQGGQQSTKDNKNAGNHPKSAGSSLRRYNEQALVDHVRSLIRTWSDALKKCSLIFYRASGPYNRTVLFGGKDPVLDKTDPRLRTIPFSTSRATFTEIKRVLSELSSVKLYDSINDGSNLLSKQLLSEKESKRSKSRLGSVNPAKSRESSERNLPGHGEHISSVIPNINDEKSSSDEEFELCEENLEISFEELAEFGDSLTAEQRNKKRSKKKPKKSKAKKLREFEEGRNKILVDTLIKGNTLILQELFEERVKMFDDNLLINRQELAQEFFNEILDEHGNSFLHLAVMNEHEELLKYLLENEADPCVKNKSQQTAYSCSQSRISREILRKFATENPEKYNYNKAQIPLNVLTDEELAEKKRAQRKIKREKEKEKKKELAVKLQEQDQKNRFINLSDSEKRALAAERRILNAQGKVIARCFLCGSDIAGKVPFQYLENRFCSVPCLQSHRLKSTVKI